MTEPDSIASAQATDSSRGTHPLATLPNQLTVARVVLSVVFFVFVALQTHGYFGTSSRSIVLNIAGGIFILAVVTDFLDGFLARRWGLVSTFGRIADPFADKIVICGGFIMLIGVSNLVEPWFAVVILFREFLVSGLRSFIEARGISFAAVLSGKLKMLFQSFTIPAVLIYEANFSARSSTSLAEIPHLSEAFRWLTLSLLAITLVATLGSCLAYLRRARKLLRNLGA